MQEFNYTAKDLATGQQVKGDISAENQTAAARLLNERNLYPISIKLKSTGSGLSLNRGTKVKAKEKVLFTRQLATLINAGLPITTAISTAAEQLSNQGFRDIIEKIEAMIQGGSSIAEAFAQYPKVFDNIFISMLSAGEASGTLDQSLDRLAKQLENQEQINSKVKGAMVYPMVVLVVIGGVLVFMLTAVLPQVATLYDDLGAELPALTQALQNLGVFMTDSWFFAILIFAGIILGIRAFIKSPLGHGMVDQLKVRMPVFKDLVYKMYMATFCRTLSSLIKSGVQILDALAITKQALTNKLLVDELDEVIVKVRGGVPMSQTLKEQEHFLPLVSQMTRIGEESGTLGEMLEKVANFYEEEVNQTVKNISTLIEPAMMVIMGVIVMGIIGAILYPIYSLVGQGFDSGV